MPACVVAQVPEGQRRHLKGTFVMAKIRKRTWKSGGEDKTAWVADYFDQNGKRHIKTFKQRKEADAWLVATRREVQQPRRRRERGLDQRHKKDLEVGVDIPTKNEIRAMLAHAQGWVRPLIVTATFTGLRASELRGLRWGDVDLDRGELTVRQRADRWGSLGSPKSDAGKRDVPLAPVVVNALREWRLACPKGAGLVFPNTRGK